MRFPEGSSGLVELLLCANPMSAMSLRGSWLGNYRTAWSILIGCGISFIGTLVYWTVSAQPFQQVKIAEVLEPSAQGVLIDGRPALLGSKVAAGQQVLTLANARISLQESEHVFARLAAQSSVTLEKDCLQLGAGEVVVAGVSGCVGAAIVTSSTGVFVLERFGTSGEVKVLSGEITLAVPSNPAIGTIALKANQKVTLSLTGDDIGPIRLMLPSEVSQLLTGSLFQGFQLAIAKQDTVAGLPSASPSPSPSVIPSPLISKPPVDKLPPPATAAKPVPAAQPQPIALQQPDVAFNADDDDDEAISKSKSVVSTPVPRFIRRRRYVEPSYETPSYSGWEARRRWSRSPAYRRRPAYSEPSYSEPTDSGSAHAEPTPAPSRPDPAPPLPSVPEIQPEQPTPIDLPPSTFPAPDPLPPPSVVEPPLDPPVVK